MTGLNNKQKWIVSSSFCWVPPANQEFYPHGDMPGDKIRIQEEHIAKAALLFPSLLTQIQEVIKIQRKAVICICGGSGVGKSEVASLLGFYFQQHNLNVYVLSGDNYPHRIPKYNDAERLRIFRTNAIKGMIKESVFTENSFTKIRQLQLVNDDANVKHIAQIPWFASYIENGRKGLQKYLGSQEEIDFEFLSSIVENFKAGEDRICIKHMGREEGELWYNLQDFSQTDILIVEWTHGNSDLLTGVDIPIFLNSTPQETLAHRRSRNRDIGIDSPFTTMILKIEQEMLHQQAHKAKMIVSNQGELLSYEEYCRVMQEDEYE